jgi:Uma2 family endonuclease
LLAGDLGRAPDVAFVRRERWLAQPSRQGALIGPPDLAVEVVSPSDSARDLQRKVEDWLSHGTLAVLLMFPEKERIVLWNKSGAVSLRGDEELDLDPSLPGFRCKAHELFPPPLADESGEPLG